MNIKHFLGKNLQNNSWIVFADKLILRINVKSLRQYSLMKIADPDRLIINLSILFTQPTGIGNYAENIFPYLQCLDPTLLSRKKYPGFNCYSVPNNLTANDGTKGHLRRLAWTQFQIPKIYDRLGSSLLFSPVPEAPIFADCRYTVTVHDFIPLKFPNRSSPLYQYFKWYVPQVLNQATHIICNSTATAAETIDRFQIPASKVTPILLGYNANHFYADNETEIADPPYFLYLGRHDPYKNVARIIAAFGQLSNGDRYELWLGGSGDRRYTPQLRAQVAELGLEGRVKFLEYIPYSELPKVIRQARALVFPSLWEGFGLPVLEAMACGTPVITSNLSALVEVASDAAILVDPYQVKEIAAAMYDLSKDDELHQQLRQAGLQRASQFSWEQTAQATIEVLQQYL
jgi:glycosyltransferase involved in cell wall biosynthesis